MPSTDSSSTRENSPRPFFVPSDINFDDLSEELKTAIRAVIDPAYRQLVLEARDGLEKSIGVTIVHLLWIEILDQLDLAQSLDDTLQPEASDRRFKMIERHLRVVNAKSKASGFLLRLHTFQRKFGVQLTQSGSPPETIEPPGGWPQNESGD